MALWINTPGWKLLSINHVVMIGKGTSGAGGFWLQTFVEISTGYVVGQHVQKRLTRNALPAPIVWTVQPVTPARLHSMREPLPWTWHNCQCRTTCPLKRLVRSWTVSNGP